MAGLLDLVDDPASQGLLSLGLRLMSTPGSFGTALGQSGLGALGDLNSAAQAKQRRDLLAQEERSRAMQMQMLQQQMAQQQEAQARQKAIEEAYRGAMRSPEQQAMQQFGGPTMGAAQAAPGMSPQIDQQALIRGLTQADPMAAYAMMQPKQKKLSKLEPMRGPDGKMINVAVYEDGTTSVLPYGVRPDIALQGLGDRVTAIDKNAVSGGESFRLGQSPDSAASNAVQMRGQNIGANTAAARLAFDQTRPIGGGNPRTGPMSVTLQKELLESDDAVQSAASVVRALEAAKTQNQDAYSGYLAKPRATLRSNLPGQSAGADATIDIDNLMTGQGLDQMKSIFGAAPTEGERKILMDMQASVDKTPKQREAIMDRAIAAAKRRSEYATKKAGAIRDGSYLTDGVPQSAEPAAKTVVRTGTSNGRKVVEYSDGSIAYAD